MTLFVLRHRVADSIAHVCLEKGQRAYMGGDWENARRYLYWWVVVDGSASAALEYARLAWDVQDLRSARDGYETALDRMKVEPVILYQIVNREYFRTRRALDRRDPEVARAPLILNKMMRAILFKTLSKEVPRYPFDPDLRYEFARELANQGYLASAIREWREALRLRPDYVRRYFPFVVKLAKARGAVRLPAVQELYARLAAEWGTESRRRDLERERTAQSNRERQAVIHHRSGVSASVGGNRELARTEFLTSLRLSPNADWYIDYWLHAFNTAEAEWALRQALRLRPRFPMATAAMALERVYRGQMGEAERLRQTAERMASNE